MGALQRIRIRLAEDEVASAADKVRHHDTFACFHSADYNAIERPRLERRLERARLKLERLRAR